MDLRFTLFNCCTLLVIALAVAMTVWRFRGGIGSYVLWLRYAVFLGYAFGFRYSLDVYVILAGAAVALAISLGKWKAARWVDLPVYLYVVWRGIGLLAGW